MNKKEYHANTVSLKWPHVYIQNSMRNLGLYFNGYLFLFFFKCIQSISLISLTLVINITHNFQT